MESRAGRTALNKGGDLLAERGETHPAQTDDTLTVPICIVQGFPAQATLAARHMNQRRWKFALKLRRRAAD